MQQRRKFKIRTDELSVMQVLECLQYRGYHWVIGELPLDFIPPAYCAGIAIYDDGEIAYFSSEEQFTRDPSEEISISKISTIIYYEEGDFLDMITG